MYIGYVECYLSCFIIRLESVFVWVTSFRQDFISVCVCVCFVMVGFEMSIGGVVCLIGSSSLILDRIRVGL